jgi:glutamate-ammonia-ligase adenylyltransferase
MRLNQPPHPELLAQTGQQLQRWQAALRERGLAMPDAATGQLLQRAFYCSEFVADAFVAEPDLLQRLFGNGELQIAFSPQRLTAFVTANPQALDEAQFMRALRRFRRQETVRIALRDLYGWAALEETFAALSGLADFCIQQASDRAWQLLVEKHGAPVSEAGEPLSLIILGMGKLGGGELNFSSDVDLIFAYAEAGSTRPSAQQRPLDAQEFFVRQAQLLIRYLHEVTEDGFVFRVDTRLRPFGDSGALAVTFDFMETYYQNQGRDWERYAMIKARPVCGDAAHAARLLALLKPFVYRRYLDYGAFAALRQMKGLIMREVVRKGMQDNVKLGAGGIREVEFIAQAFQLIRGGREPELRQRELMPVLRKLGERKLLQPETVQQLLSAYLFLRDTENRLQMMADQQTHRLPKEPLARARLLYAMGYPDWDSFSAALDTQRRCVSEVFASVVHAAQDEPPAAPGAEYLPDLLDGRLPEQQVDALLQQLGFTDSQQVLETLRKFRAAHTVKQMSAEARQRLYQLLPPLFNGVAQTQDPATALARVLSVVQAVAQRSVYLALLSEYPDALRQLIQLCASSGWITEYLAAQPILLDSLLDTRLLYQLPDRAQLAGQLHELMQSLAGEDFELQLNVLRHFKHEQVLRIAAIDVLGNLPLMKVSDQLTWLAEAILNEVQRMAGAELIAKFGRPWCGASDVAGYEPELALIGYGKLGGIELGYSSDLDLVFLHNSGPDGETRGGPRAVANEMFFARYAQRIMQILDTHMPGGVLYEADPRLRPDGEAGPLVSSLHGYAAYQRERAWVWEHQALVRARVIVGSADFSREFTKLRGQILSQPRPPAKLLAEVRDMRNRMRTELARSRQGEFDLKQDRGGIADIEFIVQYGVLAWSGQHAELLLYPDNIRILEQFGQLSLLPEADAQFLIEAYRQLRGKIHRLALQGSQAVLEDPSASRKYIDGVATIWNRLMETP